MAPVPRASAIASGIAVNRFSCAGLLSLTGALTYAQLAALIPRSGGEYAFLRTTLGELPALLFGWMRLTVSVGTCAAKAVAVTVFLSDLVPLGQPWLRLPQTCWPELSPRSFPRSGASQDDSPQPEAHGDHFARRDDVQQELRIHRRGARGGVHVTGTCNSGDVTERHAGPQPAEDAVREKRATLS